jgi:hypothetical protein
MKFYGYQNRKINCLFGTLDGGQWIEINLFKYLWLKINGYMTKCKLKN